jgi:hypothetical protein
MGIALFPFLRGMGFFAAADPSRADEQKAATGGNDAMKKAKSRNEAAPKTVNQNAGDRNSRGTGKGLIFLWR